VSPATKNRTIHAIDISGQVKVNFWPGLNGTSPSPAEELNQNVLLALEVRLIMVGLLLDQGSK
jgi:hypothetical protein